MASNGKSTMELAVQTVQVLSVVAGVVISILSFNATRDKEAEARRAQALQPFLEIRHELYMEAVKSAAILADPVTHSPEEMQKARTRFRELYIAELSMVESPGVEASMVAMARAVDPDLIPLTPPQQAAYNLAHTLRDSFVASWDADSE